jgi:hypothetical protein
MIHPEVKQPLECPTCKTNGRKRCPIHGEGGGSSGGNDGSSDHSEESPKALKNGVFFGKNPPFIGHTLPHQVDLGVLPPGNAFNAKEEGILNLLAGKLSIDNDNTAEHNALTIKLDSSSLSIEQKDEVNNFLNSIADELQAVETDKKGNILSFSIKMPMKTAHEAFMQQLLSNNEVSHFTNQGKVDGADNKRSVLPSPFSMKPTPRGK